MRISFILATITALFVLSVSGDCGAAFKRHAKRDEIAEKNRAPEDSSDEMPSPLHFAKDMRERIEEMVRKSKEDREARVAKMKARLKGIPEL